MKFEEALVLMKQGKTIRRKAWSGTVGIKLLNLNIVRTDGYELYDLLNQNIIYNDWIEVDTSLTFNQLKSTKYYRILNNDFNVYINDFDVDY